jgi:ribosomal protein S18 acetylase RimI-like enzyme
MSRNHADEGGLIGTRWSTAADDRALAEAHAATWRYAYAGILPGVTLERMISRRGPSWWSRMHDRGARALVLDCDGTLAGYATLGRSRAPALRPRGEIYELYVRPEFQGCGLGRRLFTEGRAQLRRHGLDGLLVWALADNEIACRFYRAMGGAECAHCRDRFCGVPLEKVGFDWR